MKTILYILNDDISSPENRFLTKTLNPLSSIDSVWSGRLAYKCNYVILLEDGQAPRYLKNRRGPDFSHSRDQIFEMLLRAEHIGELNFG